MIPVPDVVQLVSEYLAFVFTNVSTACSGSAIDFPWYGHLSQTLRLAVNPLKYNGKYVYCIPI